MSALSRHAPGFARLLRKVRPAYRRRVRELSGKSTQQIFTEIYESNHWSNMESRSGAGSTLSATETLRQQLPALIDKLEIRTLLDAPCGDFAWMQSVDHVLDRYIGGDIVRPLVEKLQAEYGDERRSFVELDICTEALPDSDAILCRDCLLHLANTQVHQALSNMANSTIRYALISNYPDTRRNVDSQPGLVRHLNLELPPFNLPAPVTYLDDPSPTGFTRKIGVWRRDQLPN